MSVQPARTDGPSGPSAAASVLGRLTPDLRRDPREELRDMTLKDEAKVAFQQRLPAGATLTDDRAPDPYDDSPAPITRAFSVLRAAQREIVLLQIPDWIADDGRYVGALDETRYAFRGKTVRIVSRNVNAPSLGLDNLIDNWKGAERIDTEFVAWRYVKELGDGRHSLSRVLRIDAELGGASTAARGPAQVSGPKVFVSYAHVDQKWQGMLMKQLSALTTRYPDAIWTDHELEAGDNWMIRIVEALKSSPIVILLVSPSFIDSKFIKEHEFSVALSEAAAGRKTLLWVYCTTCPFESVGIGAYQAAHDIKQPLDLLSEGEQWAQLKKVHDHLATALEKLASRNS
jgi:hypothetical protein